MKRKVGNLLMITGAVLVSLALLLFLHNEWEAKRAETQASQVLEQMREQFLAENEEKENSGKSGHEGLAQEDAESEVGQDTSETENRKVMVVDGREYMGWLSIPAIGLELPVMAEWSYAGLKTAPGRYSGSLETGNLVIAGHNYARHFSPIKWLDTGTEVDITDASQTVWHYQVSALEKLNPDQVQDMTEPSETDDWNLTLFTCTTGGQMRYAVRCKAVGMERRDMP